MGLFMGALADRVHRPRLIAVGLVLWSALTCGLWGGQKLCPDWYSAAVYRSGRVSYGALSHLHDLGPVSQSQKGHGHRYLLPRCPPGRLAPALLLPAYWGR
jgi:MFS family permease